MATSSSKAFAPVSLSAYQAGMLETLMTQQVQDAMLARSVQVAKENELDSDWRFLNVILGYDPREDHTLYSMQLKRQVHLGRHTYNKRNRSSSWTRQTIGGDCVHRESQSLQSFRTFGRVQGNYRDIVGVHHAVNSSDFVHYQKLLSPMVIDGAVLRTIGATKESYLGIKWLAENSISGKRDVCFAEMVGYTRDANGREIGFVASASIDVPECPELGSAKLTRMRMKRTMLVISSIDYPKTTSELFIMGTTESYIANSQYRVSMAILNDISLVVDSQNITRQTLAHHKDWVPDENRLSCTICSRSFHFISRRRHHCRMCGDVICKTCYVNQFVCREADTSVACQTKFCLRCIVGLRAIDKRLEDFKPQVSKMLTFDTLDVSATETFEEFLELDSPDSNPRASSLFTFQADTHTLLDSSMRTDEEDSEKIRLIPLTDLTGFQLCYVRVANIAIGTLNNTWFNSIVMLCISWASLSVGLQTYPTLGESIILNDMDLFVLAVFILEAFIKIMAEGLYPWRFFTGKEMRWNCFDFAIIVMSLPIWGSALGGSSIAILRMLRLMRIMKLVKRIPQLYMIVMGLIGGLKSIGYIMLLLFLVFYLYAISGITLENWATIMDINYFGCDRFDGGYYSTDPAKTASFQYCNVTRVYGANVTDSSLASQRALNQVMATLYFITFILISAFVMLSLFIGAITMSMTQSMEHMKKAQEEAEAKKRAEKARKRAQEAELRALEAEKKRAAGEAQEKSDLDPTKTGKLSAAERRERQKMREVLMQTWDDCDLTDILTQQQGDTRSIKGAYLKVAGVATKIVEHPKFSLFVTCVIIMAGVMVGLQTSSEVVDVLGALLTGLDTAILTVFTAEVILKILAEGLEPWNYFRGAWNVFDFIIVVGSFTKGSGGMLTMLRLLRLLRVLKLVRAFPQLQVIVSALIKGVSSIGNDPFHFQYLHFAMISLFQLATMDGWSDVLYINYYGCDLYGYDAYRDLGYECKHQPGGMLAVLYFFVFIVLGGMVLITLFIGVVTTSMEEATQEMEAEKELVRRVEALRSQHDIDAKVVASYMQVFRMLDLDGSGSVEEAELRTGLAAIGKYPTYEELKEMMDVVDEDGSGQIDIVEFVEFMIHVREKSNQQHAARLAAEAALAAEVAAENAAAIETSIADSEPMNGEVGSSSARHQSVNGTEDPSSNGEKVLVINNDNGDEASHVAPFKHSSRSWSSPRAALSPRNGLNCSVMPYISDKESQDANVDANSTNPGISLDVEAHSEEGSETALLSQEAPARPRSGRVTSKILPSG
ncbi:hypothetical protein PInf_003428 [Phytophthora infestans]|nr:hypothetical protein PInf_003428 [Phytophthora infestans]